MSANRFVLHVIVCLLVIFLVSPVVGKPNEEFTEDPFIGENDFTYDDCYIVVSNGAVVTIDGIHSFNRLEVIENIEITHLPKIGMDLTIADNVTVELGSLVTADAKGFESDEGQGSGLAGIEGSGAGYGGAGANRSNPGGGTYGSLSQPSNFGSGVGTSTGSSTPGSRGGGVIRLTIGGTLTVVGEISADGGIANSSAGDGSGGSIWIDTNDLVGFGFITATGGYAPNNGGGGGGGGGRIAIYVAGTSAFDLSNVFHCFRTIANQRGEPS